MKCQSCKSEIKAEKNFCPECGNAVVKSNEPEGETNQVSDLANTPLLVRVWIGALVVVVLIVTGAVFSGGNSRTTPSS